jgi:hypothetical protein
VKPLLISFDFYSVGTCKQCQSPLLGNFSKDPQAQCYQFVISFAVIRYVVPRYLTLPQYKEPTFSR